MRQKKYNPRDVVGKFFEAKAERVFGLTKKDRLNLGNVPDFVSEGHTFYAEVKGAAYNNGGVINIPQIERFQDIIETKRFYIFGYHSISRNRTMRTEFLTKKSLWGALDVRSFYIFPFSIIYAYYMHTRVQHTPKHPPYVQLTEKQAKNIFCFEINEWRRLELQKKDYQMNTIHEKVFLVTRDSDLEEEIMRHFHPESIEAKLAWKIYRQSN